MAVFSHTKKKMLPHLICRGTLADPNWMDLGLMDLEGKLRIFLLTSLTISKFHGFVELKGNLPTPKKTHQRWIFFVICCPVALASNQSSEMDLHDVDFENFDRAVSSEWMLTEVEPKEASLPEWIFRINQGFWAWNLEKVEKKTWFASFKKNSAKKNGYMS